MLDLLTPVIEVCKEEFYCLMLKGKKKTKCAVSRNKTTAGPQAGQSFYFDLQARSLLIIGVCRFGSVLVVTSLNVCWTYRPFPQDPLHSSRLVNAAFQPQTVSSGWAVRLNVMLRRCQEMAAFPTQLCIAAI